jgi:hypothetical protein
VWLDRHGNRVQTEEEAYGRKKKYLLKHPDKLIFMDEVGENISQKRDGNTGGQKFVVATGMRAQIRNPFKDNHSTVIGFTTTDGRPFVCAIIIVASKLHVTDVAGFNPWLTDGEDITDDDMAGLAKEIEEMNDEHSNDIDRMFPFGPTCTFNYICDLQ